MNLYIVQFYDPNENEYSLEVLSEAQWLDWQKYAARVNNIDNFTLIADIQLDEPTAKAIHPSALAKC